MDIRIRAVSRLFHFLSVFGLGLYLASDYTEAKQSSFKFIGHISGIVSLVSGLINWYLLKSFKAKVPKKPFTLWTSLVHSKTLFTIIFLTPIIKFLIEDHKTLWTVRLVACIVFIVAGVLSRYIREESTFEASSGDKRGLLVTNKQE